MALTAAETGHLVFGTLHTSGAPSTINRIIDVFPPEQQEQIRAQISTSLKMVATQRLLKTKDGQGRVGAFEIMKCTPIQNLIREAKFTKFKYHANGNKNGMVTMEKSLEELVKSGKIDPGAANQDIKGFTILELLVVITIVAVVSAVGYQILWIGEKIEK